MKKWFVKFETMLGKIRDFLDEKSLQTFHAAPLSKMQQFLHFWLQVIRSFLRNRCPTHASSLAYTSLLALIPTVFVAVSISSGLLKQEGGARVYQFIDDLLLQMTPAAAVEGTNAPKGAAIANTNSITASAVSETNNLVAASTNSIISTNQAAAPMAKNDPPTGGGNGSGREQIIDAINGFIQNIQTGRLGATGVVALILMIFSMASSIESSFNHIWGVTKGRNWWARVMQYWTVLSLGSVLLAAALALASERRLQTTKQILHSVPPVNWLLFHFLPFIVLCLAFSIFYVLIPNTKVKWKSGFFGGLVGGLLWLVNNYLSVLFVSRWVSNKTIYGGLAVIPVLMIGLYFSWLILLFGAQVAHAFQNRMAYLEERQAASLNQRCREFIALRLMESLGRRFQLGQPPASASDLAKQLMVPGCLVEDIMEPLIDARLAVEVAGVDPTYAPAKPLENIDCHDILLALRAGHGQELPTRDDPARAEVFIEFERILEAERKAASAVTVLAMVNRAEKRASLPEKSIRALMSGKSG